LTAPEPADLELRSAETALLLFDVQDPARPDRTVLSADERRCASTPFHENMRLTAILSGVVVEDCCAAGSDELHRKAFAIINMIHCHAVSSAELVSMMGLEHRAEKSMAVG
jgi:hypothetical protein